MLAASSEGPVSGLCVPSVWVPSPSGWSGSASWGVLLSAPVPPVSCAGAASDAGSDWLPAASVSWAACSWARSASSWAFSHASTASRAACASSTAAHRGSSTVGKPVAPWMGSSSPL